MSRTRVRVWIRSLPLDFILPPVFVHVKNKPVHKVNVIFTKLLKLKLKHSAPCWSHWWTKTNPGIQHQHMMWDDVISFHEDSAPWPPRPRWPSDASVDDIILTDCVSLWWNRNCDVWKFKFCWIFIYFYWIKTRFNASRRHDCPVGVEGPTVSQRSWQGCVVLTGRRWHVSLIKVKCC